jgi:hypothetical protein
VTPVLIIAGSRVMARSYGLWRGVGACIHLIFISASVLIAFTAMIRDSVHSLRRVVAKKLFTTHVYLRGESQPLKGLKGKTLTGAFRRANVMVWDGFPSTLLEIRGKGLLALICEGLVLIFVMK